jgi:hypothetical protein
MKNSNFLSVNSKDILKGLLMTIITPAIVLIENSVSEGNLQINTHNLIVASIGGGLGYLIKNFFTKPNDK